MSQTTDIPSIIDEVPFFSICLSQAISEYATLTLLGGLYGVFTVLSLLSVRALTLNKTRRTQPVSIIILCLVILILFISTTTYLVTYVLYTEYSAAISRLGPQVITPDQYFQLAEYVEREYGHLFTCAATATLTINVFLGDAIVCWRVSVIWERNRRIKAISGVFLLTVFVLSIIDTVDTCTQKNSRIGELYSGSPLGIAVCVLSLSTNLLATLFVGYKAWQSRRRLKEYLVVGSQVEKVLALLIESGAVYCTFWGAIVVYQIIQYEVDNPYYHESSAEVAIINISTVVLYGGIVPLVAIYPAIIIVLVALNKSQIENALSQNLDSVPTPQLTVKTNTVPTRESPSHYIPEALTIDSEGQGPELGDIEENGNME